MSQLDDGLRRRVDWKRDAIAERPMISAAVAGERGANVGAPKNDADGVRKQRPRCRGEPVGRAHRRTMESDSTLVNDAEVQRVLLPAATVVDDQVGGRPKRLPDGNRLLGSLDRAPVHEGDGVSRS